MSWWQLKGVNYQSSVLFQRKLPNENVDALNLGGVVSEIGEKYPECEQLLNEVDSLDNDGFVIQHARKTLNDPTEENERSLVNQLKPIVQTLIDHSQFSRTNFTTDFISMVRLECENYTNGSSQNLTNIKTLLEMFQFACEYDRRKIFKPNYNAMVTFYRRFCHIYDNEHIQYQYLNILSLWIASPRPMVMNILNSFNSDEAVLAHYMIHLANSIISALEGEPNEDVELLIHGMVGLIAMADYLTPTGEICNNRSPISIETAVNILRKYCSSGSLAAQYHVATLLYYTPTIASGEGNKQLCNELRDILY
eukprot:TRINITY_DN9934_c0_g1_i1.p1 TRINITY_DN9934_c0_g1~~TRINITY_DN9934_c0_g1_i1.p1  ORF type:complete len:309 (-),score=52.73 TRINITY_DN9934_c0_g1_i1:47-973(-)